MAASLFPDPTPAPSTKSARSDRARSSDVLLVEDDDLVRRALRWLLGSDRRECVAVASAEEAQQLLAVHEPALIVTDLNLLGRRSGIDLLVWMRGSPRLRDVPMLLMTGDDPVGARSLLDAAGLHGVDVLCKPFGRSELKEALARLLDGDRAAVTGGGDR